MSKIVLFGVGGGADTAKRYFSNDTDHQVVAHTVDAEFRSQSEHDGLPVVDFEKVQDYYPPNEHKLFILLSFDNLNQLRIKKYKEGKEKGYEFASYICSNIFSVEPIVIGENCFIMENQTINLDVKIGDNVVMWSGNHVGDRSIIEDHVWISSQVAIGGDSCIGEGSFVGMHATVGHGVKIGVNNFIGANTLITKCTNRNQAFANAGTKTLEVTSQQFAKVI